MIWNELQEIYDYTILYEGWQQCLPIFSVSVVAIYTKMTVKEHYDNHLGNFYSWFIGDFASKEKEFRQFLIENRIIPSHSKIALDLGAGNGIQSVAMAKVGFNVTAIDFNKQLLEELKINSEQLPIKIVEEDICSVNNYAGLAPELIICCGDTLMHLESKSEIKEFIKNCASTIAKNGKLILSFRNYTDELKGNDKYIPVKSDDNKILTCILEYKAEQITVTDLLYERTGKGWIQKVSSYNKVRILPNEIEKILQENGLKIIFNKSINRLETIIAKY